MLFFWLIFVSVLFFSQFAFQGTVVTIENFLSWKAKFEQEMTELKRKRQKEEEQSGKGKLTGELLNWYYLLIWFTTFRLVLLIYFFLLQENSFLRQTIILTLQISSSWRTVSNVNCYYYIISYIGCRLLFFCDCPSKLLFFAFSCRWQQCGSGWVALPRHGWFGLGWGRPWFQPTGLGQRWRLNCVNSQPDMNGIDANILL